MDVPFTILLVEDELSEAQLIRRALENGKLLHNLVVVTDGGQAMAYLRQEDPFVNVSIPDLILLDLTLPIIDGWEVLKNVKTSPEYRRIPVVILTNTQSDKEVTKAYDLQANSYIVKPLNFEKFTEAIIKISEFWMTVVQLPDNKNR